jgi:hypothetical protein
MRIRIDNGSWERRSFCRRPFGNEGLFTLKEAQPRPPEFLKNQKSQEDLNELIRQLREGANIEILTSASEVLNP